MTTSTSSTLRTTAVKSAAWYGATRLWGQLVSWVVTIVLARLLAPDDYGLFAIALSVLSLLELLQEFGLGTAIIQRKQLSRQQINAVFWIVGATSFLLTMATFGAAGTISDLYGEPRLALPLRILCLTFLLNSLGMVPHSLLTKAINLRHRSLAEAIGVTSSALVALILAYLGYGVLALVGGHLARAIILNVLLAVLAGWFPGLRLDFSGMRGLMSFGIGVAGTHVVATGATALSTFILARVLSGAGVGLYAMAQSLTEAPNRLSAAIINQVSFPVFSKLQDDPEGLAAYFLKISKYLAVVALPVQVGLALVAPDLIPLLLSSKWDSLIVPFQILCFESVVVFSTLTCSPLIIARGLSGLLFRRALFASSCLLASTLMAGPFGLIGVVTARLVTSFPSRLSILMPALRELNLSLFGYLKGLASPLIATALMSTVVLTMQRVWPADAARFALLVGSIAAGAVSYTVALFLLDNRLWGEIRTVTRDLRSTSKA
jgi:teichuronic acid exporter